MIFLFLSLSFDDNSFTWEDNCFFQESLTSKDWCFMVHFVGYEFQLCVSGIWSSY